ncbi:MAG: hypothetical protein FJ278_24040, partial [Planctomycetes bacterium]|nr:hypothetical protein [Planctomycetota bacterium]
MPTHTTRLSALRSRIFLNTLRTLRTEHSLLKIVFIALFAIAFWAGLFWAFFDAFRFLRDFPDLRDMLIEYLFYLFFMTLLLMLAISSGIIAFTSLFRARETAFLWTLPVRFEDIFVHKQAETLVFSSWAVVSVGTPLIIAYGITFGAPWHFYILTAFFFVVFVVLPAQVGGMAALALTAYFPRSRKQALGTLGVACVAVGAVWGFQMFRSATGTPLFTELWMKGILDRLSFCQNP